MYIKNSFQKPTLAFSFFPSQISRVSVVIPIDFTFPFYSFVRGFMSKLFTTRCPLGLTKGSSHHS